jgi:hypothetical protein
MSHASCLNLEAYIKARRDPWQRVCNLLIAIHFLSKLLKKAPNFSKKVSKMFKRRD